LNFASLSKRYQKSSKDVVFFAMLLIAASLFFSRFLISVGFVLVGLNWIFEGQFKEKLSFVKKNKAGFYIVLLWLLHLIGLLYTKNIESGINDIRIKTFLFFIFVYGSGTQISNKRRDIVFQIFILSALITSVIFSFNFYIGNKLIGIEDLAGMSFFGGNLYQGILISFAISLLCYFLISNRYTKYSIIYYFTILWFIIYLFLLNSLTGYILLFFLFVFNSLYLFVKQNEKWSKLKISFIFLLIIALSSIYVGLIVKEFYRSDHFVYEQLPKTTISGNIYTQDTISKQKENGHYLYLNFCQKELEEEWNVRSFFVYDGLDKKHQQISQTLIRYLSSKNLTKDSVGVWALSINEIQLIENGYANYLYTDQFSIKARLYIVIWQLDKYFNQGYANRQTISQRLVYTKAAFELIKGHFWTGVGPGDVVDESNKYIVENTGLTKEYSNRVHIQFLVEFVGLGIFGFIVFTFFIFYPYYKNKMWKDYLFTSFFLIVILSFFSEYLFETQLGITFFAYFYSLLFFKPQEFSNKKNPVN